VRFRDVYTVSAGARVAGDWWNREFGDRVERSVVRVLDDLGERIRLALRTSFRIARDAVAKPFTMDDLASRIRGMIDGKI
jgi:hypothetical protein